MFSSICLGLDLNALERDSRLLLFFFKKTNKIKVSKLFMRNHPNAISFYQRQVLRFL